ncbi:MAG: tRNA (adenosine(37)-N6)-threonylcarbamoyltransferase complex transferase subunit TsaD [Candidatus Babeliales bacterium]
MNPSILGIETSCDETAAAVYANNKIQSNIIFSQVDLHQLYGGVVPEIASRSHIEKINTIVAQALAQSKIGLNEIDIVAVTNRPGLPGSLLIGVCFAKALAWVKKKPIIGIDHLEGHAFSTFLEYDVPFPHLCLTASGGHTSLYLIHDFGKYDVLGTTLDDAAGEAFDKIAKLINLPYPGGPIIEKLAKKVNFEDFFHYPRSMGNQLDFSFSGLKTAILYDLVKKNLYNLSTKKLSPNMSENIKEQIASSLLVCINDIFIQKIELAIKQFPQVRAVTFVGGVASNKFVKENIQKIAEKNNKLFFSPSSQYCTDNAAMIAFVGSYKAKQGIFSDYNLDILKNE